MRALIVDLLACQQPDWYVSAVDGVAGLGAEPAWPPDIVVIDAASFFGSCDGRLGRFPVQHLVVIGPEPDPFYRQATLDRGAGAWLSRDDVSDELGPAISILLGRSAPHLMRASYRQPGPRVPPPPSKEHQP